MKKISKFGVKILALIVVVALASTLFTTMAVLIFTAHQQNSVHIKGVNLLVSPSTVTWDDLEQGTARDLFKFDTASLNGATIVSATLVMQYIGFPVGGASGATNPPAGRSITVNQVTSSWTEMSASWNNQPTFVATPTSTTTVPATTGTISVDVTGLVQQWVSGTANNGLMVKFASEATPYGAVNIGTKEGSQPAQLQITYYMP